MSDRILRLARNTRELYFRQDSEKSLLKGILEKTLDEPVGSGMSYRTGTRNHPFNLTNALLFKNENPHHAACIEAKKNSIVGLGLENEAKEQQLDDLCENSFNSVITACGEDYVSTGTSYIEVAREGVSGKIKALFHAPVCNLNVYVEEEDARHWHYEVRTNSEGRGYGKRFPRFGDAERFYSKYSKPEGNTITEIIKISRPTGLDRFYGFPDWLSGVAAIELVQCLTQHTFDFFLNRGVPECILFALGQTLDEDTWLKIESAFLANIGLGNSFKTMAVNLGEVNLEKFKLQLEKLGVENGGNEMFSGMIDSLAMQICARSPPRRGPRWRRR